MEATLFPREDQRSAVVEPDLHPTGLAETRVPQEARDRHIGVSIPIQVPDGQVPVVVLALGEPNRGRAQGPIGILVEGERTLLDVVAVGHQEIPISISVEIRKARARGVAFLLALPGSRPGQRWPSVPPARVLRVVAVLAVLGQKR